MKNTKLRLNKVYVDGYKNLSECSTYLNDFNVLVGPNNSGKSNFLEIFAFVRELIMSGDDFRKRVFEHGIAPRGDSSTCRTEDDNCKPITISFFMESKELSKPTLDIEYSLTVQCRPFWMDEKNLLNDKLGFISEQVTYKDRKKTGKAIILIKRDRTEMQVRKTNSMSLPQSIESYSSCLSVTKKIYPGFEGLDKNFNLIYLSLINLLSSMHITLSPNELREDFDSGKKSEGFKLVSFDLLEEIAELHKNEKLYEQFTNTLCQILDLEETRFLTVPYPEDIRKNSKDLPETFNYFSLKLPHRHFLGMRNFSDGTFRVVALLISVLSPTNDNVLTLIEEPENCLHPKAVKTLISYLKQISQDKQIFITTHSSYLLNNVSPEDVIVARIKESGDTTFEKILNIKDLRKRLSRGFISFGDLLYDDFRDE